MKEIQISQTITNRESRSVEQYLNEIAKTALLNAQQEVELGRRIRQGDQAALHRLTKANLRFVVSVAKKYQNLGVPLSDLISEGNIGLMKAAQKFDETKGFKFISFAVFWIRQSILEAVSQQSRVIRLPNNQVDLMAKVAKYGALLEQQQERRPTEEELAEFTDTPLPKVKDARHGGQRTGSLDAPLPHTEALDLKDLLATPESEAFEHESFEILTERERYIIEHYYGFRDREYNAPEIAGQLGCSAERIRQIRRQALQKLKKRLQL